MDGRRHPAIRSTAMHEAVIRSTTMPQEVLDINFLEIKDQKDFLDRYTIGNRCTDKEIKFFKSVMDGKVKFVKHALNIGSIRNHQETMLAAIHLACRFGQPEVLDALLHRAQDQLFKTNYFNFGFTVVAGISEAMRLESGHKPSGIIDILIKYARKSFDERKLEWVCGKIDMDEKKYLGEGITTPFMELCGSKNSCTSDVIKKILDAEGYVVDVKEVTRGNNAHSYAGDSALSHAVFNGEKEVVKIILEKMLCKDSTLKMHNCKDENLVKFEKVNQHIQEMVQLLRTVIPDSRYKKRQDIVEIFEILIEHCLRVTQENEIGNDNAILIQLLEKVPSHEHLDAMIVEVIERERRIAHIDGKLTWFDLYDFQIVQEPIGAQDINLFGDQIERYFRSVSVNGRNRIAGNVPIDIVYLEEIIQFMKDQQKKSKCWSCGHSDSGMMVCKQCREARYCDVTCQEENWNKHQIWCKESKYLLMKQREEESEEERESRRLLRSYAKDWKEKNSKQAPALWIQMATVFQNMCYLAKNGKYYF